MDKIKYDLLLNRIDFALKNSSFVVKVKEHIIEHNILYGDKTIEFNKEVTIVSRKDQFIVDNNGVQYSVLSDSIIFPKGIGVKG